MRRFEGVDVFAFDRRGQQGRANPRASLAVWQVVLAGSVHAWKKGIPARVRKESPETRQLILLPNTPGGFNQEHATADDGDYLLLGL